MDNLRPIDDKYLEVPLTIHPGSRLHCLVARLFDTYYDDLDADRIEHLERIVDGWRATHADGKPFEGANP